MKKLQKKLRILTLVLIAGLLFSSVTVPASAFIQKQGTVNEAVTLRQNADTTSSQVMQLSGGQQVVVNNELTAVDGSKWYQVFVNDTTIGYVPTSTITITGNASGSTSSSGTSGNTNVTMQTITVTERVGTVTATGSVRVRAEATTSSNQVASMGPNDTFLVLEDTNAADGYVWHKIELDDNGTIVTGYVRSDLVSVKEVTHEEQVPVENPESSTPSEVKPEDPYSVISEVNAEGTTVWYLVDNSTGDSKEITALLTPQKAPASNNGVYKIIVVILLILVILAAAAATFFYMRWQDAEAFIYELREKQVRARKQTNTTRTAPSKQQTTVPTTNSKPAANKPVTNNVTKPGNPTTSKLPPIGGEAAKPAVKPASQPVANKPAETTAPKTEAQVVKPEAKVEAKDASQPEVKVEAKEASQPEAQAVKTEVKTDVKPEKKEVIPNTSDIVNATKKELQDKQPAQASSTKSGSWKSKNFLTDDDDLEFDFLDMDEK